MTPPRCRTTTITSSPLTGQDEKERSINPLKRNKHRFPILPTQRIKDIRDAFYYWPLEGLEFFCWQHATNWRLVLHLQRGGDNRRRAARHGKATGIVMKILQFADILQIISGLRIGKTLA